MNNVEGMKGIVWAVFYHSLSTDDIPQHSFSPLAKDHGASINVL